MKGLKADTIIMKEDFYFLSALVEMHFPQVLFDKFPLAAGASDLLAYGFFIVMHYCYAAIWVSGREQ